MKPKLKRTLAAALSAALALSSTPAPALARALEPQATSAAVARIGSVSYVTVQDAVDAAGDAPTTIALAASAALTYPIQVAPTQNITLDLRGYNLSVPSSATPTTTRAVVNRGTFTLADSAGSGVVYASDGLDNVGGSLTVAGGSIQSDRACVENRSSELEGVGTAGRVTVQGGALVATGSGACVKNLEGGSVTLQGGSLTSDAVAVRSAGTLTVPGSSTVQVPRAQVAFRIDGGTASIGAGTFTTTSATQPTVLIPSDATAAGATQARVTISGGTFTNTATGTFTNTATGTNPPVSTVVLGTALVPATNSTLSVTGGTFYGEVRSDGGNVRVSDFALTGGTYYQALNTALSEDALKRLVRLVAKTHALVRNSSASATATTIAPASTYLDSLEVNGATGAWAPVFDPDTPETPESAVATWTGDYDLFGTPTVEVVNHEEAGTYAVKVSGTGTAGTLTLYQQHGTVSPATVPAEVATGLALASPAGVRYSATGVKPGVANMPDAYSTSYAVSYAVNGGAVVPAGSTANVTGATVTFTGNYQGSRTISEARSYTVERTPLADLGIAAMRTEATYTGSAQLPEAFIYDDGVRLAQGTDYQVSASNTTDVSSSVSYTVTGVGNYGGTITRNDLSVAKRDLSDAQLVFDASKPFDFGVTRDEIKAKIAFRAAGEDLKLKAADYTVSDFTYLPDGVVRATVSGASANCYGAQYVTFKVNNSLADATVTLDRASYAFTGAAVTPAVTVKMGDSTVAASHYVLEYADNEEPGTGTVTVTPAEGDNALSGSATKGFAIVGNLGSATATLTPPSYGYMGVPVVPKVQLKLGDYVVPEAAYAVTAANNTQITTAATYSATAVAGSAFSGSAGGTFAIARRDISDRTSTLLELDGGSKQALAADGTVPEPSVLLTDVPTGTRFSLSPADLEVEHLGVQTDGSYKVRVKGVAPNCTGTVDLSFTLSTDFADANVTVADQEFSGLAVTPPASDVQVRIGTTVIDPSKYTYAATKNGEPGEGGIIVTPAANSGYSGVKVAPFNVIGNLDKAQVTLDRAVYAPDAEGKVAPVATVRLGSFTVPSTAYDTQVEARVSSGAGVATVVPAAGAPYRGSKSVSFLIDPEAPATPDTPDTPATSEVPDAPDNPTEPEDEPEVGQIPVRTGDTATGEVRQTATGDYVVVLSDGDGNPANGWVVVGGDTYYAKAGTAVTGKQAIGTKTYVFGTYDAKLRMGFVRDPETGATVYAVEVAGRPAGATRGQVWTDGVFEVGGVRYVADANGALKTGWHTEASGARHYLFLASDPEATGSMAAGRWFYVAADEGWFYADAAGNVQAGWYNDAPTGTRYFLERDDTAEGAYGKMKTGWLWDRADGNWYYLFTEADGGVTGSLARNGWLLADGSWYLLSESGTMLAGWQYVGAWYYLSALHDGTFGVLRTGWVFDGTGWFYTNASGAMQAGWLDEGGSRYYLSTAHDGSYGRMLTGWVFDGSGWYYLGIGGKLLRSTWTPDGRYVDAFGRWVA